MNENSPFISVSTNHAPGHLLNPSSTQTSKWVERFDLWQDDQAGVMLIHDRRNKVMTVSLREKPPEAVREMFEGAGCVRDPGFSGFSKRIDDIRPVSSWSEAEQFAFDAANMIRAGKGLEQRKSFSVSRG